MVAVSDAASWMDTGCAHAEVLCKGVITHSSLTVQRRSDIAVGVSEGRLPVAGVQMHLGRLKVKPTLTELERRHLDSFGETLSVTPLPPRQQDCRDGRPRLKSSLPLTTSPRLS
jgi:hypothetical protein